MNRLHGYQIGIFNQEMDRAEEIGDYVAIVRAARKLRETSSEIEDAIFDQLQKDGEFNGKTSA